MGIITLLLLTTINITSKVSHKSVITIPVETYFGTNLGIKPVETNHGTDLEKTANSIFWLLIALLMA